MMTTLYPSTGLGGPTGGGPTLERREALRLTISPETSCHLIAGVGETLWPARVLELSTRGIRLQLRRRFAPGASVILELANGARVFACALIMRVVHVTEQDDGAYVLGGAFARKLTHHELTALLA
jgi:hypothetical protein